MASTSYTDILSHQSLAALCTRAGVRPVGGRPVSEVSITRLAVDSRRAIPGSCFVAVRGTEVDGHWFVDAAIRNGAVAVVVNTDAEVSLPDSVSIVRVGDTRDALARLAAAYYEVDRGGANELRLVGITGTNGKSTVAWLLRSILRAAGEQPALFGTIEYDLAGTCEKSDLTTPPPLELCQRLAAARQRGARFGVLEVSSHALDQRRCDGLTFEVALFTNLSGDHLNYHGTMDAYFAAKQRLFDLCDGGSTAVLNTDDEFGSRLIDLVGISSVGYGLDFESSAACLSRKSTPHKERHARGSSPARAKQEVRASIISVSRRGSEIQMSLKSGVLPVRLSLIGLHNVSNALAAAAAAEALGIEPQLIRSGLESVREVPGRLQQIEPPGCPFSVLVDYAHTDAALENVLTALRPLTSGRLICVFGCGGDRDREKRPRMAAAVGQWADLAFVTSDNPRSEEPNAIIKEILPGFPSASHCRIEVEPDRRAAIEAAIGEARPGDTVLIAGKGHEDYQIVGDKRLDFDDAKVAQAFLGVSATQEVSA
jgi:UDP-N-acetylmuramoyl-L-alanyl-D-glutamate--2,6-diaminopimelate ligase